jgi:hypothetical protein
LIAGTTRTLQAILKEVERHLAIEVEKLVEGL